MKNIEASDGSDPPPPVARAHAPSDRGRQRHGARRRSLRPLPRRLMPHSAGNARTPHPWRAARDRPLPTPRAARPPFNFNRHRTLFCCSGIMLQQMPSPPYASARIGEVAGAVRMVDTRLGEVSSGASSDTAEDLELPQCKIRRNYNCTKCTFYTQNPRVYLVHTRDIHFEKFKIYDCPYCIYASRHQQKLNRHIKMLHTSATPTAAIKMECEPPDTDEQRDRIEDLLEEVEECEDSLMEVDDCLEENLDRSDDVENDRLVDRTAAQIQKSKVNFFSCDKCNYVTHIRSRYTKHVKYHSMPMIKCTICEFRTPYKWNLDRHMKNHGGTGSFHCSMCNFTADIKQSLTVHEMNHHTPAPGQSVPNRRRNRVGGSEIALEALPGAVAPKEEEGSGDSRSSLAVSDMGILAEREIVSCNSDSNEATTDGNMNKDESQSSQDGRGQWSPGAASDDAKSNKHSKRPPRPIPQLIPLNASTPNQTKTSGEPPAKKFRETPSAEQTGSNIIDKNNQLSPDVTIIPICSVSQTSAKDTIGRHKNVSFFDRLKARLLTETGEEGSLICKNCGFESKCLSEHSVHEKTCTSQSNRLTSNTSHSNLGSTRCQNCRHRCKSSADLYVHMQSCRKSGAVGDANSTGTNNSASNESSNMNTDKDVEPHPMENVVFVWNNINDANKFDTPLDININDDSTLPELTASYEAETTEDNDNMNLSPSQAVGKKVFKCPYCPFWASTASRFHVHIVGHLNKKPFECSLCKYKSNWRWDITKHIKLKSARDPEHNDAKVLMTDETGRRNYSKYNKFLAMPIMNESGVNKFHYIDPNTAVDSTIEMDEPVNDVNDISDTYEMQPLNLQTQQNDCNYDQFDNRSGDPKKPKKTLWKCKRCNYKDPSKEALLEHVREHARVDSMEDFKELGAKKPENMPDPADLAYRCGHCNQLSNWKHVIQRHCRLKHDGIIKVITTVKPKCDDQLTIHDLSSDTCSKCPFRTNDKKHLRIHMQHHQPSPQSVFKCYFCPFFVREESELTEHLYVHGITDAEDYVGKNMASARSPPPEQHGPIINTPPTKRHKCTECPYETNSKSQYMYHEQFHRLPADTPYKCPECNYSVSKRHLLHQHLRVHGIITKKNESEAELEAALLSLPVKNGMKVDFLMEFEEIPFVWVSAKNEFHKMYKCRYCSYVHSQKCKIPSHEKIHYVEFDNNDLTIFKCLECKFTCDTAYRLAEHSKTHGEIYGRIYCPVEDDIPEDEQIAKLRKVIEAEKANSTDDPLKDDGTLADGKELKIIYFCRKCPSRFYKDSELKMHDKFHDLSFPHKCKSCDFSAPEENDLIAHVCVHSDEYRTKTKILKFIHYIHPAHKEPQLELKHCPNTSEITWVVTNPSKNYDNNNDFKKSHDTKHTPKQHNCKECPAKFFKSSALSYHVGLHGGEGEHKCKKCSYAVKNVGNLAKHELLHENEGKTPNHDYDSADDMDFKNIPLSGTDLFQRKTEAQKRVLIDKDKLVKPNDHFPPVLQADPQFGYLMHGNPEFIYPTYLKNGRQKEKRYKCHKCPSAFEKREQYKIHLSLHGSKQRYKCELCDYSVKYYANYVQHMRKHQMNDEALAERKKGSDGYMETENQDVPKIEDGTDNIKLAIKTMPKGIPKSDFQQFSISDQQTLRLLQRRRAINNTGMDQSPGDQSQPKERKLHMCILCPYTNQRQDALNNHYRRHDDTDIFNAGNHHKCSHCDLVVVQSHFLRDHMKTHFNYQKSLIPECYVANEDVRFTITKIDDDNNQSIDLTLDVRNKSYECSGEKIFVKIKTGELLVE